MRPHLGGQRIRNPAAVLCPQEAGIRRFQGV